MTKLYNTQTEITNKFREFSKKKYSKFKKNSIKYHSRNYIRYDFF